MGGSKHFIQFYIVVFACLVQKNILFSQKIKFYPDQHGSTPQTLSLINPVYLGINSNNEAKIGSKNNTGIFNDIRSFYGQINFNISEQGKLRHNIGADFIGEQEGPIIRKNRMHFNYSLQKQVGNDLQIGLGMQLGLASFDYNSSKATSQGSSIGPDGSVALLINYSTWNFGLHINQIFDQAYRPKVTTFHYPIFFGYYLGKTWELKSKSKIEIYNLHHLLKDRSNFNTVGLRFSHLNTGTLGINYHHNRYITPTLTLQIGQLLNTMKGLSLFFSYNFTIQQLRESKLNAIELGITFQFK